MTFPGLKPTFVKMAASECQRYKDLDATRQAILINLNTGRIIQAVEGGTTEKPPKGYTDFRDFTDNEFDEVVKGLLKAGFPQDQVAVLRAYRSLKR